MVAAMLPYFDSIYSIELSADLFRQSRSRFNRDAKVKLVHGDSAMDLPDIVKSLDDPALFWLDGHYSDGETVRGSNDTPVRDELLALARSPIEGHVILIDDARLFGVDPEYPSLADVEHLIDQHFPMHQFSVKDDIIRIVPAALSSVISARQADPVADADGNVFELRPVDCPVCGVNEPRLVGYRGGASHRYGLGIRTAIVRCNECGLLYSNPFPFPVDPQVLYGDPQKYFASHDVDSKVVSQRQIITGLVADSGLDEPSFLDVGSGRGEALHAAQAVGLTDVVGLELSSAMRDETERRYGVDIRLETIEQHAAVSARTYDIIMLSAVLEHVYDPDAMIASVAALSHRGTVVYIDVPQEPNLLTMVGNLPGRLRGTRTVYNLAPTFPPYHVFGFNPRSMTMLLEKHGFRPFRWLKRSQLTIPSRGGIKDRATAFGAMQVHRLGNLTGLSTNMDVWARKG